MAEYIDREAVRNRVCKGCTFRVDSQGCANPNCCEDLIGGFIEAPTIDAAQVVHGRWIVTKEYNDVIDMDVVKYTCSACEEYRLSASGLSQSTTYCPSCGAKMDITADE